jgi:hypothetical protein
MELHTHKPQRHGAQEQKKTKKNENGIMYTLTKEARRSKEQKKKFVSS